MFFFLLFFEPYKTTKRKKRKAFNWYEITYIDQATFHFLFINHIHISKVGTLSVFHCRRENKLKHETMLFHPSPAHQSWPSSWSARLVLFFFFLSRQEEESKKTRSRSRRARCVPNVQMSGSCLFRCLLPQREAGFHRNVFCVI